MKRAILVVCVVLLVGLAGCTSGGGDDGDGASTSDPSADGGASDGGGSDSGSDDDGSGDGSGASDDGDGAGSGDAGTTTGDSGGGENGGSSAPEIQMLQFDRTETYEYETVAYGADGTMSLSVDVEGDEATLTVTGVVDGSEAVNEYVVPTNDPEAVEDALSDDLREPGIVFLAQSRDVSNIFVMNDLPFEVGSTYEGPYGNVTVTGEDTIGGVDCLTYEFYVSDTLAETGCLSERLEVPVMWEKYDGDEGVRLSIRLVSYEEGNARFVGHALATSAVTAP